MKRISDLEKELAQLREENRWIPVSEALGPRHKTVLCLNADGRIFQGRVCYGMHAPFWTYPDGDKDATDTVPSWINVTHWKYITLPSPPKAEQL